MLLERFLKEPISIQYLGTAFTQPCLEAIRSLIQHRIPISTIKLLTAPEGQSSRHGFLMGTEQDELIAIRPGFTSGYCGEGPRGLASALQILSAFEFQVEEHVVTLRLLNRLESAALTTQDLKFLDTSTQLTPTRLHNYIYEAGMQGRSLGTALRTFEPIIPFGIIDERLADLAIRFFEDPNARLINGYARLEGFIKNRTGLSGAANKLFSAAFEGPTPKLRWLDLDPSEQIGRAGLFKSAYQTYRNRRVHNEVDPNDRLDLAELLLLNNLFVLESCAVTIDG
ncbi:TIGR02391 family protein [Pseudomonas sp. CBC3]|uniref:TIGR02391 family protein n=1 Tax=Pseudomonas sp. CBC3 TaxID=3123318 RepID=UPI0030EAD1EE